MTCLTRGDVVFVPRRPRLFQQLVADISKSAKQDREAKAEALLGAYAAMAKASALGHARCSVN